MTHIYTGPMTKWGLEPGTPVRIIHRQGELCTTVARIEDEQEFLIGSGQIRPNTNNPRRTKRPDGRKRQKKGGRKK